MLLIRILFLHLFVHLINGQLQINLYLTNWTSNDENNNNLQHDGLYAVAPIETPGSFGQIISYCMSEWPSKWEIEENNIDKKFTFADLSKQNITSQQLYIWSAPMDVIENYQFYLDQLSTSKNKSMETQVFYNCTLPYFGPMCQYMFNDYNFHSSSLNELIHNYYCWNRYEPATLTCYTHLQCSRGVSSACFDWTDVCDGKIDCLDNEQDEKECWQLEMHECAENEYRCFNGQCIPEEFFQDNDFVFDCLDRFDELQGEDFLRHPNTDTCFMPDPTFSNEDISCIKFNDRYWTLLTSSCISQRSYLLLQSLFSIKPMSLSDECWTAFKCVIDIPIRNDPLCKDLCSNEMCDEIIRMKCPDQIYVPAVPILLGHVYLAYEKKDLKYGFYESFVPMYFCYNNQLLHLPDDTEIWPLSKNYSCRLYKNLIPLEYIDPEFWIDVYIDFLNQELQMYTAWIYNDSIRCNKSTMYQCKDSRRCISQQRLFDKSVDCLYDDDENITMWNKNCSMKRNIKYHKCELTNECIPYRSFRDGNCDCEIDNGNCEDERSDDKSYEIDIFPVICDNFTHLSPIIIDGRNQDDETGCDQWQCNNIYTYCNGFWNCLNGADELNCNTSLSLNCPPNNHICWSFETKTMMCLSIDKVNDGNIDCIGGADEPTLCRVNEHRRLFQTFYCKNNSFGHCIYFQNVCDSTKSDCETEEDEQICTIDEYNMRGSGKGICQNNYESYGSDIANTFCKIFSSKKELLEKQNFKLGQIQSSSEVSVTHPSSHIFPRQSIIETVQFYQPRCHRGLDLQVWINKEKNLTTSTCLCPPSYYGDICQFQNQRVSVTIQFRTNSDSIHTPFIIIISLIDDSEERIIHSYEQFTYLAKKHCLTKFHAYLLYSTRPKNATTTYSIHIDIYERTSLNYRGSFNKPLLFPFLPVHRLSFILNIPQIKENMNSCLDHKCINGKCKIYFNHLSNMTFCQCNYGWSDRYCTIQHNCKCSSDSLCIGKLANNRSLCVCPLNKMGDRCLLNNTLCQIDQHHKCSNHGRCIITDEYKTIDKQFICICDKGFSRNRCEIIQSKLIVSFYKNILVPSSIIIHFIEVHDDQPPNQITTYKTISFGKTTTTIYWSSRFHIVLIEWINNYYLTVLQKEYNQSVTIEKTLQTSDRCLHISELFNETIVNYHLVRRIKYYQIPCQMNRSTRLSCFYDNIYFCLCQDHAGQRVANCFNFNYTISNDCFGHSDCENGGQCFQDDKKCPQTAICICPVCYYGSRCELTTNGFSLSLDFILGYHIRSNINLSHQSATVFISITLSIIITLAGTINGILTLITFKNKKARIFGCGIYLLCSSINTLLLMIIFSLKFWILILSHVGSISNRSFLYSSCISIDFLLRFSLTIDQWLTACVSFERAYITIKNISLNKKKIKSTAKLVISILILFIIGTHIHDPMHRRLLDENNDEEKRTWCIVSYSSGIHIFNLIMTIFHIIIPFIVNLISAIVLIIVTARQRAAVHKQQKYENILREQIQQHRNLLIGPCILTILAIPRVIISFSSGCMTSTSLSWVFLLGYFISFIPSLLTFILFVLPSSTYYQIYSESISRYRNLIRMCS